VNLLEVLKSQTDFFVSDWSILGTCFDFALHANRGRNGQNFFKCINHGILYVCVLENHVFLDPEIKRSIAARDVFIGDAQLRASSSCASAKTSS
jgi:hypothetical protein